jgi:hypothetical protein
MVVALLGSDLLRSMRKVYVRPVWCGGMGDQLGMRAPPDHHTGSLCQLVAFRTPCAPVSGSSCVVQTHLMLLGCLKRMV